MTAPLASPTRRGLLGGALAFAAAPLLAEPGAGSEPQVAFLAPDAAADALAHAPGDAYFANMSLVEIRARLGAALPGMALADARVAARDFEAAAVLPFSDAARAALGGVIDRLQPLLAARAPRYAHTPWSFIQLADRAEGGLPHTRGPHIVLPARVVEWLAARHRAAAEAGTLAASPLGRDLLLHEQTHVLQRADPARFEPLYTGVFGFERMDPAPTSPWLATHAGTNPDAPRAEWAFPLDRIGGRGWVMPLVTFADVPVPRMGPDFRSIGVEVARGPDGWRVVESGGVPRWRLLDDIPGYHAHFPFLDDDSHPNEIAAVAISHWLRREPADVDALPLMRGVAAWAANALA